MPRLSSVTIMTITAIVMPIRMITVTIMAGEERMRRADTPHFTPADEATLSEAALYRLMIWLSPAYPMRRALLQRRDLARLARGHADSGRRV